MSMVGLAGRERSRHAVWRLEEYVSLDTIADWLDRRQGHENGLELLRARTFTRMP